jgi:hypothetical protein
MPTSLASTARKFQNLEGSDFEMTHSSKRALMFAASLGAREIMAVGYPAILREAIIRGATKFKAMPLCDDPLQQISFFPEDDSGDHIFIGENLDWVFTGASLAGAIAQQRNKQLIVCDASRTPDLSKGSVLLVTDSGLSTGGIDIRRIKNAAEASVDPEGVLGNATFIKQESAKGEIINGDPSEVGTALTRKLRRLTRTTKI